MRKNSLHRARARAVASLVACVATMTMTLVRAQIGDDWGTGTATWYGGVDGPGPDGMSIYTGSCACASARARRCARGGADLSAY